MPFHFIPVAASFPQIANNRTIAALIEALLDYTGGADRTEAKARARRALQDTINSFNEAAWRFNRKSTDITFVADTTEYDLPSTYRDAMKMMLLDASDQHVGDLDWVPYEDFLLYDGSTQSTVTIPDEYTTFNVFDQGKVRFLPRLGAGPFTNYPKARLYYHQRIVLPSGDSDVLQVPPEVESAIVKGAAALLIARVRSFTEAQAAYFDAIATRANAEREWRDWPDFQQKMG